MIAGKSDLNELLPQMMPDRRRAISLLGLALAYLVVFRISNIFQSTDLRATPWTPEAGFAILSGFLCGWIAIPVMFVANFTGNFLWGGVLPTGWKAVAALFYAVILAGGGNYFRGLLSTLRSPTTNKVVLFLFFVLLVSALAAMARFLFAAISLRLSPIYLMSYAVTLSVGNLIGAATIVPFSVSFPTPASLWRRVLTWDFVDWILIGTIVPLSLLTFGYAGEGAFKYFYLIFLPVIAIAVRRGFPDATIAVLLSDVSMVAVLFWQQFETSTVTDLQILMISLSATALILGASVSERLRISAELEESHERYQSSQVALLRATRISLAGEMAAALSHELNQPLSSVRSFVRAVRRKLDKSDIDVPAVKAEIDAAVEQIDAAAELIKGTRRFLERGDMRMTRLDLANLLGTCLELVAPELRMHQITLATQVPSGLPPIVGNLLQLQQVVLNLIRNAKEALVECKPPVSAINIAVSSYTRPGFVEVSIEDSGPGVAPAIRPHLFTPLQSSKSEGLGLGLSLCSSIIVAHGGEIWYDGKLGEGARFVFTIPVVGQGRME